MKTYFVDTNVFLGALTRENPQKTKDCMNVLKRAARSEIRLRCPLSVIAEVVYVLRSKKQYGLSSEEIRRILVPILGIQNLFISEKKLIYRTLDIMAEHSRLDFEDALQAVLIQEENAELLSYDRDFDAVADVQRIEPSALTVK